jgi:hypothetical protein
MTPRAGELDQFDELLKTIEQCSPAREAEFASERIREARTYLRGGMPYEYEWALEVTRRALTRMKDTKRRRKAQEMLHDLPGN